MNKTTMNWKKKPCAHSERVNNKTNFEHEKRFFVISIESTKKKKVAKIFMTIDKKKVQRWLDSGWVDLSMLKREKTIAMRPTRNRSRVTRWMTYRTELLLRFFSLLMLILPVIIIILSFGFTFFLRNFDSFEFNTQNEKQIASQRKQHTNRMANCICSMRNWWWSDVLICVAIFILTQPAHINAKSDKM